MYNTHTHTRSTLFCHPPDPANASAAGPAATEPGPSPGEGANASMVFQKKTTKTHQKKRANTATNIWKIQKTKQKNMKSASGGESREYKKYAAQVHLVITTGHMVGVFFFFFFLRAA